MFDWYANLSVLQKVFAIFATLGGILFVIQLILMLVGGDSDADGDVGGDGDLDTGDGDLDGAHADSDVGFKLLSYQGLTAFFMMFGLAGLAMNKGSGYGALPSVAVATVIGAGMMLLVAKMFQFFKSMQSSGTIELKNAIGKKARVYLTIKPEEPGQVEVEIQGHLNIYDALSKNKVEIPTDAQVKVVDVINGTMIVEQI